MKIFQSSVIIESTDRFVSLLFNILVVTGNEYFCKTSCPKPGWIKH